MARRKLIASGGRSKQPYSRCSGTPDVPHEAPLAGMPQVGEVPRKHPSRKTRPVTRPVKGRLPDQEFVATIGSGHLPVGPLQTVTVGPARVDIPSGRLAQLGGWADVGNLHVGEAYRRQGVASWLVGQAADWLRLARVERLLDYAQAEHEGCLALLRKLGFRELTRTARGWVNRSGPTQPVT